MDFEFLPKLPKSNLDDRTYKDLVDECVLRIPRYCPEWSNFNPSDPGITLIELFAWLTDQMLLRFNQVPRRNYVAFLELLGIRLQAPTPAQTEITFYLSRPQSHQEPIPAILAGTEVATERTETEEAVIFSTDKPLRVGMPWIRHCLTAELPEVFPQLLRDRFANLWTQDNSGYWSGPEQSIFQVYPQVGNCFYLVFDAAEPLDGNVIVLDIEGEPAGSTGINPDQPPRYWEAWSGESWHPILLAETDDGTRGFSFSEGGQAEAVGVKRATVTLHMPLNWPDHTFGNYHGRWLRCVYTTPQGAQTGYSRSPKLTGIAAHTIGGTGLASQCTLVRDELLGDSNGKPGQTFQLQSGSVLPRKPGEHLMVLPSGGLPQIWQEVHDFAESGPDDTHYTLDSVTGEIQFGPLIREPAHLSEEVQLRRQVQSQGRPPTETALATLDVLERQHGAVPPRGAVIRMAAYRTGGGQRGNVQRKTVRILKSAVPYVTQVVNHRPAFNGADAESLDEAVIRVPSLLRTRDRAVTPEDFETLTRQASRAVARAYCPRQQVGGQVRVVVVPRTDATGVNEGMGIAPERFRLSQGLKTEVLAFLDERRVLGIEVLLEEPSYVGVSVQAEVGVSPEYAALQAQQEILRRLRSHLYRFLNPLTGGVDGTGWAFGTPVYKSDIVGLLQTVPGVQYLGTVELFALRLQEEGWLRSLATEGVIHPGPLGLICSWASPTLRSEHAISLSV